MFYDLFKRENVVKFFKDISLGEIYKDKEIPSTINNEVIDTNYYSILMGLDAIIKYVIIVEDMYCFDEYLKEVQLLLRKVKDHNDIKIGITKLLINYSKLRLGIKDTSIQENKEEIIRYIYKKYIIEGYFFYAFPSIFINDVLTEGLKVDGYNYELDSLKEVQEVFNKYKKNQVFSKNLEKSSYLTVTDSVFMGCFYAYNSPNFLREFSTGLDDKTGKYNLDSLFMKNYNLSRRNLNNYIKKTDMFSPDSKKIVSIFDKEWNLFNIKESFPVMALIKRSDLDDNYLSDITEIIDRSKEESLESCVSKILNVRYNKKVVYKDILKSSVNVVYLPKLEELGIKVEESNIKEDEELNEYGNTSILALVGVLLIMFGILVSLVMIG